MSETDQIPLPIELAKIREMTDAMRVAAEDKRWSEVQRIDDARMKLLRTVPAQLFASSDRRVRDLLTDALAVTRLLESQAREHHTGIGEQLKDVNRRHHAAKSYASAS